MTDLTGARFYAISTIGYGLAHTAEEAVEIYYTVMARSYSHLHRTMKGRIAKLKEAAPPTVFEAPADATGFTLDGVVRWQLADNSLIPCTTDPIAVAGSTREPV